MSRRPLRPRAARTTSRARPIPWPSRPRGGGALGDRTTGRRCRPGRSHRWPAWGSGPAPASGRSAAGPLGHRPAIGGTPPRRGGRERARRLDVAGPGHPGDLSAEAARVLDVLGDVRGDEEGEGAVPEGQGLSLGHDNWPVDDHAQPVTVAGVLERAVSEDVGRGVGKGAAAEVKDRTDVVDDGGGPGRAQPEPAAARPWGADPLAA